MKHFTVNFHPSIYERTPILPRCALEARKGLSALMRHCAKFHENWCKTEKVVCDARFSHFCHNMPLPWQHTFYHCQKNVSCTSTPQGKHLCQISWELVKNWGSSSRRKIFSIFAIICCCHGNTLSATVKKMCLAHLHPKANICAKFHENWWKTEEVVRDARFSPHFFHNMPLPWQHTFCHCQKNVSCTSTPQGKHLCQISWELVKNWGRSSRRKIFPPFWP